MPHGAYDDGELEISLAPSANRRAQNKPPDASSRRQQNGNHNRSVEPAPQKKAEQRIGAYHIIRWLSRSLLGRSSSVVIWLAGSSGRSNICNFSDIPTLSSCESNFCLWSYVIQRLICIPQIHRDQDPSRNHHGPGIRWR
jgi:hypothetical protein